MIILSKRGGALIGYCWLIFFCFSLLLNNSLSLATEAHHIAISDFQQRDLSRWQTDEFEGLTDYSFVQDDARGWVLKAHSIGTASCLIRKIQVDLNKTPFLNWSWKAEKLPDVDNVRTKVSDDYPARIYVIFKTGPWFWNTRALNYVWSTTIPVGESWPNAFASEAKMVAVRSGGQEVGRWVTEKRNIRDDIAKFFDMDIEFIEAVALMTDTDNANTEAIAYYDNIYFSDR